MQNLSILATAASGINDGTTVTANGATMLIGSNTGVNGNHGQLRFDTSAILSTNIIVSAVLSLVVSGSQTPGAGCDFWLWAAEFGSAIAAADYNKASSNTRSGRDTSGNALDPGNLRQRFKKLVVGGVALAADQVLETYIPSRFIMKGANGLSDFEIRPSLTTQPTVSQALTLRGPAAVSAAHKPTLAVVAATPTELRGKNVWRNQGIGDQQWAAFGRQPDEVTPVKANTFLDTPGYDCEINPSVLMSDAFNATRSKGNKSAPGIVTVGGSIDFEATPERLWALLLGFDKISATRLNDPITGVNESDFVTASYDEISYFTFVVSKGQFREAYMGSQLGSLSLSVQQNSIVTGSVSFMARDGAVYDKYAAGALDDYLVKSTAGPDTETNGLLSFAGGLVRFDGEDQGWKVEGVGISIQQGAEERRGLTQSQYADGHVPGGLTVTADFNMHFTDEDQLRRYFGKSTTEFPFRAENNIVLQDFNVSLAGKRGCDTHLININVPKFLYLNCSRPVRSKGLLKMSCRGVSLSDSSQGSINHKITVRSTENHPVAYAAETDLLLVLPEEIVKCQI